MNWGRIGLLAGALAMSVACSEQVSAPKSDDDARDALLQRVFDLKESLSVNGRMTAEQKQELAALQRDVIAWQARTGRDDISVSHSEQPRADDGTLALTSGGVTSGCEPCPQYKIMAGYVCFLVEVGPCRPGEFITQVCAYMCFKTGPASR